MFGVLQNEHFNHPGCNTTFGMIGNSRRGNSAAALFAQVAGPAQSEPDGALELRLTPSTSEATASKATNLFMGLAACLQRANKLTASATRERSNVLVKSSVRVKPSQARHFTPAFNCGSAADRNQPRSIAGRV